MSLRVGFEISDAEVRPRSSLSLPAVADAAVDLSAPSSVSCLPACYHEDNGLVL